MATIQTVKTTLRNGHDLLIRSTAEADARAILNIRIAIAREGTSWEDADEIATTVAALQGRIRRFAQLPGCLYLTAEVDGAPRGCLWFQNGPTRRTEHAGELGLLVARDWRRQGIGAALLRALFDWAEATRWIEIVGLTVLASNAAAIALYQRFGFVETGRVRGAARFDEGGLTDNILMSRAMKGTLDAD